MREKRNVTKLGKGKIEEQERPGGVGGWSTARHPFPGADEIEFPSSLFPGGDVPVRRDALATCYHLYRRNETVFMIIQQWNNVGNDRGYRSSHNGPRLCALT